MYGRCINPIPYANEARLIRPIGSTAGALESWYARTHDVMAFKLASKIALSLRRASCMGSTTLSSADGSYVYVCMRVYVCIFSRLTMLSSADESYVYVCMRVCVCIFSCLTMLSSADGSYVYVCMCVCVCISSCLTMLSSVDELRACACALFVFVYVCCLHLCMYVVCICVCMFFIFVYECCICVCMLYASVVSKRLLHISEYSC
jgi:hypothetical protein